MSIGGKGRIIMVAMALVALATGTAHAAQCGNNSSGYEAWKAQFSQQAAANGIGSKGLQALAGTRYATRTISADRGQRSFKLSLSQFMEKRGANVIIRRGKKLKSEHARLFANLERQYGVPPGPLIAIWGMESNFGGFMGKENILSAVATLAYDCRRSAFFTEQLYAALQLVETNRLSPGAIGAAHGEVGQTQFLPLSVVRYGVDGNGDGRIDLIRSSADALASTANFLRAHGWRPDTSQGSRTSRHCRGGTPPASISRP